MPKDSQGNWVSSRSSRFVNNAGVVPGGRQRNLRPSIQQRKDYDALIFNPNVDLDAPVDLIYDCKCPKKPKTYFDGATVRDFVDVLVSEYDYPAQKPVKMLNFLKGESRMVVRTSSVRDVRRASAHHQFNVKVLGEAAQRLVKQGILPLNPFEQFADERCEKQSDEYQAWLKTIGYVAEPEVAEPEVDEVVVDEDEVDEDAVEEVLVTAEELDGTVKDLLAISSRGADSARLVLEAEEAGKGRKTLITGIKEMYPNGF